MSFPKVKPSEMITFKTISFILVLNCVQDIADVANATAAELAVVRTVSTCCRGKHYVVTVQSTRPALHWVVMLQNINQ